jgi:hypothetical protein
LGAASILAKSVAGALPFIALFLFWMVLPREHKPKIAALAEIAFVASGLLAPWYVYQVHVHPQWLWAENIQGQLWGTGLHWDRNSVIRSLPFVYYLRRLIEMDPVLLTFACVGIAGVFRIARSRPQPAALLAVCWAAVSVAALCAFQVANLPYVTLLLPPLCIVGAVGGPRLLDRYPAVTACILVLLLLTKAAASGKPWSLRPSAPPLAGAVAMRAYYGLHRDTDLISVDPDDEFYSLTIPLPHVRYCVLDPTGILRRFAPHYVPLGITVTSEQFINLSALLPQYEKRLHEWGTDSREPIATTITMDSLSEISDIVSARPESDFYLPSRSLDAIANPEQAHQLVRYSPERVFLLARAAKRRPQPVPAIPVHW